VGYVGTDTLPLVKLSVLASFHSPALLVLII